MDAYRQRDKTDLSSNLDTLPLSQEKNRAAIGFAKCPLVFPHVQHNHLHQSLQFVYIFHPRQDRDRVPPASQILKTPYAKLPKAASAWQSFASASHRLIPCT